MSKFYIISEEEIYNMHGYADQREWDEPEIFRKEVLNPAYEVEFDGDLREFVKEKIKSDKNVQDLMEKLAATPRAGALLTPDEVHNILGKRALIPTIDDAREELNIVHCPDCKYCVKTKDGEYNPDDIVCSYWSSDGLESGDFCSYGEKGEYEWCDLKDLQGLGFWQNDRVAFHKTCPFCGCHISDNKRDVFEGDGEYNFCINCGARLKEEEK